MAASWKEGNNLWMYGGHGFNSTGDGALASLWKYQLANGLWSWEGGSKFVNDAPVYGTLKQPDVSVSPGSLYSNMTWTDKQGNLWIYTTRSFWKYQKSLGQWTWMGGGGDNNFDTPVYGERGVAAVGNWPGSRVDATVWTEMYSLS